MKPRRAKTLKVYYLDSTRGRKAAKADLRIMLEEEWRGPAFIQNPHGTIATHTNWHHDPWTPVFFVFPPNRPAKVVSLDLQGELVDICELRWNTLCRALSPEHVELVRRLANIAYNQSMIAAFAVRVAERELDVQEKRRGLAKRLAAKRPTPKTDALRKEIVRCSQQNVDPRERVAIIARKVGCSKTLVYNVLRGE